ncbi:MAG: hypothetical protein AAFY71_22130 [Bacteroidota bacterium]
MMKRVLPLGLVCSLLLVCACKQEGLDEDIFMETYFEVDEDCVAPCAVAVGIRDAQGISSFSWEIVETEELIDKRFSQFELIEPGDYTILCLGRDTVGNILKTDTFRVSVGINNFERTYDFGINATAYGIAESLEPGGGFVIVGAGQHIIKVDNFGESFFDFFSWPLYLDPSLRDFNKNFTHVLGIDVNTYVVVESTSVDSFLNQQSKLLFINQQGELISQIALSGMAAELTNVEVTDIVRGDGDEYFLTGYYQSELPDEPQGLFLARGQGIGQPEFLLRIPDTSSFRVIGGEILRRSNGEIYFTGLRRDPIRGLRTSIFQWNTPLLQFSLPVSETVTFLHLLDNSSGLEWFAIDGFQSSSVKQLSFDQNRTNTSIGSIIEASQFSYPNIHVPKAIRGIPQGIAMVFNLYRDNYDYGVGYYFFRDNQSGRATLETASDIDLGNSDSRLMDIIQTRDGSFAMVGALRGKMFLKKVNEYRD